MLSFEENNFATRTEIRHGAVFIQHAIVFNWAIVYSSCCLCTVFLHAISSSIIVIFIFLLDRILQGLSLIVSEENADSLVSLGLIEVCVKVLKSFHRSLVILLFLDCSQLELVIYPTTNPLQISYFCLQLRTLSQFLCYLNRFRDSNVLVMLLICSWIGFEIISKVLAPSRWNYLRFQWGSWIRWCSIYCHIFYNSFGSLGREKFPWWARFQYQYWFHS